MAMNKRIFAILIIVFSVIGVYADNGINSPYSRYGVGILADQGMGISRQMSGLGYALRSHRFINIQNPASFSEADTLTMLFEAGFSMQNVNFKEGNKRINARNASFDYVAIQFRLCKNLGMSAGFLPYSNVGYAFSSSSQDKDDALNKHTDTYSGTGGLYQPYIGLGWRPMPWLAAGVMGSYIYGDITHQVVYEFPNSTSRSTIYNASIKSYKVDFGLQFIAKMANKHELTLGATYSLGHRLNADVTLNNSEIPDGFSLPHTFGAGLAYKYDERLTVGADYTFQNWSTSTFFDKTDNNESIGLGTNRSKISLGAEYSPNRISKNLFKMMSYRAGVHYAQPYTKINGKEGCDEYGVSAGISIPFYNSNNSYSHGTLHISGQFVHLAPRSAGLITENYLRINIGITFNESWFMKLRVR
ncbi:MAG: hypothetical protein IKW46_05150 [Bacteroidaceae bacterium]|nr:hypothetical protein [Bacteroidaceae bacterium]